MTMARYVAAPLALEDHTADPTEFVVIDHALTTRLGYPVRVTARSTSASNARAVARELNRPAHPVPLTTAELELYLTGAIA